MYPLTINGQPDEAAILVRDERGKQIYKGETGGVPKSTD